MQFFVILIIKKKTLINAKKINNIISCLTNKKVIRDCHKPCIKEFS